jgi:hypothetical protein
LHCKKVAVKLYQQITQTMNNQKNTKIVYCVIYEYNNEVQRLKFDIMGLTEFNSYEAAMDIAAQTCAELPYISLKMIYVKEA